MSIIYLKPVVIISRTFRSQINYIFIKIEPHVALTQSLAHVKLF